MRSRKAQAAFEYLVTYGWAFLGAIIAIGALAYFGFLNPSSLLPNSCNFGKQMECSEYRILDNGSVGIYFKNNFGKPIIINNMSVIETPGGTFASGPVSILAGGKNETSIYLLAGLKRTAGQKQELTIEVNFTRNDGIPSSSHYITGTVYANVQKH